MSKPAMFKCAYVLALLVMWSNLALAADRYKITDLGTLGGQSFGHAINDKGWVTGQSEVLAFGRQAFIWDGAMRAIPNSTRGYDINDAGQVVGVDGSNAFFYDGTTTTTLGHIFDLR